MNKAEKMRYYASREWVLLKEEVRKRSGGKCERCKTGDHDATHHLTYERFGHESLEDLIGICDACHEFLSGKSDFDPAAPKPAANYRLYPIYVYPRPWMDDWGWAFSEAEGDDSFELNQALDIVAKTEIPELLGCETHFGVIPNEDYPATLLWAGRGLDWRERKGQSLRYAALIACHGRMSWLFHTQWIVYVKKCIDPDRRFECLGFVRKEDLSDEERLLVEDAFVPEEDDL